MALDASQTLDILFDEDNGLLTGELDIYGKTKIETLNFNDLDLLSDDFFSLLQQDGIHNMSTVMKDSKLHTHQIHSDHDYYAHSSPGQHSDSGVSVNSAEDFCNQTNMSEDRLEFSPTDQSMSSPPESDSPANSSPLGLDNLEEFDFSTFMNYGDTDNVNGVDISSDLTDFKDTDVSIDFDLNKLSKENIDSQLEQQQLIKNLNGQPAIILMDNKSQHVLRVQRLSSHSSSGDSLPFTLKDIDTHLSVHLSEPSGQFHELRLTDEEKELLAKEGVSLPTHMPLTKEEERTLKSVRRKIRNKVSAKESRKRKQTYMDGLEKRVKICTQENQQLQKKVENLEKQNTSLLVQLKRLQTLVTGSKGHAQASTCVMVLLLSFALLVLPNMLPFGKDESSAISADGGIRVKSRSLLANPDDKAVRMDFPSSLHSEDPYGVSSKPAPPWESKPPMTFSQLKTATQTGPLTSVETDEAGVNETEEAHKKSLLRVGENDLPLENKAEVRQGGSEKTVQDTQSSLDDKGQKQEAGVSSVNDSEL